MKINNTEVSNEKLASFFKHHTKKQKPNKNGVKCRLVDMNSEVEYTFKSLKEMSAWLGYTKDAPHIETGIVHKKGEKIKKYKLYKEN